MPVFVNLVPEKVGSELQLDVFPSPTKMIFRVSRVHER